MVLPTELVVWLQDVEKEDKYVLGEEISVMGEFAHAKIPVVVGFVVTPYAFDLFLKENNLFTKIKHLLGTVNPERHDSIIQVSAHIKKLIMSSPIPQRIVTDIFAHSNRLEKFHKEIIFSSNLTNFLDKDEIAGEAAIGERLRAEWAHYFDSEYIQGNAIVPPVIFISQKLVPQIVGKLYTIEPESGARDIIKIEQDIIGKYHVHKKSFDIVKRDTVNVILSEGEEMLSDEYIKRLSQIGLLIDKVLYFPQEIDFAIENNEIYITRVIPITGFESVAASQVLLHGVSAHKGIGIGKVHIVNDASDLQGVTSDTIVVIKEVRPHFQEALKRAKAIIIEEEGLTSTSALLAKLLQIPSIIEARNATSILKNGSIVTVNATRGAIFNGSILTQ